MAPWYRAVRACGFYLLVCLPAFGQSEFVSDTFTAANGTLLQNHSPDIGNANSWVQLLGGGLQIQSNTLQTVTNSAGDLYVNATPAPATNYVVGISVTFTRADPNNYVELYGRGNATASGYGIHLDAQGNWSISVYVGGVQTVLASGTTTVSMSAAHEVTFSITDGSKALYLDGTLVGSTTDNRVTTAGFVGLGEDTKKGGQTVADNFFASTFAPTAARLLSAHAVRRGATAVVEWETEPDPHTLGFRVWRFDSGKRTLASRSIIAGSALTVGDARLRAGSAYRFVDSAAAPAYEIEVIDVRGGSTWSRAALEADASVRDIDTHPSPTLAELTRTRSTLPNIPLPAAAPPRPTRIVKIIVDKTGWIRVTRSALVAAGFSYDEPRRLRLFCGGTEIPMTVEGESSARVDAIRFYGTALDTPSTGSNIYWLLADGEHGARITHAVVQPNAPACAAHDFSATVQRREYAYFAPAILPGTPDGFYGPLVSTDKTQPTIETVTLLHTDPSGTNGTLRAELQGADVPVSGVHRIDVTINGHAAGEVSFAGTITKTVDFDVPSTWLREGDNAIGFTAAGGDDDVVLVDAIAITYPHRFAADENALRFTAPAGQVISVAGFANATAHLLDVTNPLAPIEITPLSQSADGAVRFTTPAGTKDRTIVATATFTDPAAVLAATSPSSHEAENVDLLIITSGEFAAAVEPLRQLRESEGLRVGVVGVEDLYDRFNFGIKDPVAIRNAIRALRPRAVLLLGDASCDERNRFGVADWDFIPTKLVNTSQMKTASDAWLADVDDDGIADVPIGRLPVRTTTDAVAAIAKIVAYDRAPVGDPAMQRAIFASDDDPSIGFATDSHQLESALPAWLTVSDAAIAFSGTVAARTKLLASWNDGALLVDWNGHGSVGVWHGNGWFGTADATTLTNAPRLPIVIAMTCLNGYFHDLYTDSMANALLSSPGGGAVAVVASSTLTEAREQRPFHRQLLGHLFGHDTVGVAFLSAIRATHDPDVRASFMLFGDPSTHLRVPK